MSKVENNLLIKIKSLLNMEKKNDDNSILKTIKEREKKKTPKPIFPIKFK